MRPGRTPTTAPRHCSAGEIATYDVTHLPEALDDRELTRGFQSGDAALYSEIDRRYRPVVVRLCRRLLDSRQDAEEAVQETFIRVYQALPRFNGSYRLRPWILRIATNVCLDQIRARTRRPGDIVVPLDDASLKLPIAQDPCDLVVRDSERRLVRSVLADLPPRYRAALILREEEGLSHEQIASVLGLTPIQVKFLLHRAKRSFRRAWPGRETKTGALALVLIPIWARLLSRRAVRDVPQPVSAAEPAATPVASIVSAAASQGVAERAAAAVAAFAVTGALGMTAPPVDRAPVESRVRAERESAVAMPVPLSAAAVGASASARPVSAPVSEPSESRAPSPAAAASPSAEPSPEPSAPPSPPPPEDPGPSEEADEAAPSPAAEPQGFTLGFRADFATDYRCGCGSDPVSEGAAHESHGGPAGFDHHVSGAAAADASGTPSWGLSFEQHARGGEHRITFELSDAEGPHSYAGHGSLVSRAATEWGGWKYVFEGSYDFVAGSSRPGRSVPGNGLYRAEVTVSGSSGRIVAAEISLS